MFAVGDNCSSRDAIIVTTLSTGASAVLRHRVAHAWKYVRASRTSVPSQRSRNTFFWAETVAGQGRYTVHDLCRLYVERWDIKTIYRELKAVAKIEPRLATGIHANPPAE